MWVCLLSLAAVIAGAGLLRGYNWARWLALAWIAFHVAIQLLPLVVAGRVSCGGVRAVRVFPVSPRAGRVDVSRPRAADAPMGRCVTTVGC